MISGGGTYRVTATNYPEGTITVRCMDAPPSYEALQASFGSTIYQAFNFYYKTENINQLMQQLLFSKFDVTGQLSKEVITPAIDPYQLQNILNIDLESKKIIFDGSMFFYLPILPLETCIIIFDILEFTNKYFLPKNNMFTKNDFFKDFSNKLNFNE